MTKQERVDMWTALLGHEGWRALAEIAREQIFMREQIILREPLTPEGVFERENLRGERNGIELVLLTAETLLETAKADMKENDNGVE